MKIILTIIILVLFSIGTTSCTARAGGNPPQSPTSEVLPDPVKILEEQVEAEKERRIEAEELVIAETQRSRRRELLAVGLGVLAVITFFAGTTIGSLARRHALVPA